MPLITSVVPSSWEALEIASTEILRECGMEADRQVTLPLPRGSVDVDVYAVEVIDGIKHITICECKNWSTNVPKEVIHAFRTVMHEAGANRGYVISSVGFQSGAVLAAKSTNIELVKFRQLQEVYFEKWINKRLWSFEEAHGDFSIYYEPLGPPGYSRLESDDDRRRYDAVWDRYHFAGILLIPFSPYLREHAKNPLPTLPLDASSLESRGIIVPDDIKQASGYRELIGLFEKYATAGLQELRAVNPITRSPR